MVYSIKQDLTLIKDLRLFHALIYKYHPRRSDTVGVISLSSDYILYT